MFFHPPCLSMLSTWLVLISNSQVLLRAIPFWWMSFIFPFSWECHHPNWLSYFHIFQRGRYTTNQLWWCSCFCSESQYLFQCLSVKFNGKVAETGWSRRFLQGVVEMFIRRSNFTMFNWLVVWNMFLLSKWDNPSHWRTHIFQRGRSTTNQLRCCLRCKEM